MAQWVYKRRSKEESKWFRTECFVCHLRYVAAGNLRPQSHNIVFHITLNYYRLPCDFFLSFSSCSSLIQYTWFGKKNYSIFETSIQFQSCPIWCWHIFHCHHLWCHFQMHFNHTIHSRASNSNETYQFMYVCHTLYLITEWTHSQLRGRSLLYSLY